MARGPGAPPPQAGTYVGDDGANTLNGVSTADTLKGLGGDDVLNGNGGDDVLEGGEGNDILSGGANSPTGDTASYVTATSRVFINLALEGAQNTQGAGHDTLVGIENVTGTDFNDQLIGNAAGNRLVGGAHFDVLIGNDGDDVLFANEGSTVSWSADGYSDQLDGGAGDDHIWAATNDEVVGGAGHDTVHMDFTATPGGLTFNMEASTSGGGASTWGGSVREVETAHVIFGAFGDTFLGSSIGGADLVYGNDGNDNLQGKAGDDFLYGGGDNDSLLGGVGADRLHGDAGADSLGGEEGDDVLIGGAGADALFGHDGLDTASYATATAGVRINRMTGVHTGDAAGDQFFSIEAFSLTAQADNFVGREYAERVDGLGGNDVLNGGAGADVLNGGDGDDRVNGGDDDDRLTGGAGDDLMDGGLGTDNLTGGAGADFLHGRNGDDTLDGGAGADTLVGGDGIDVATYRLSSAGVEIDLASGVHTGDAAGDTFNSIEYFVLTNHNDSIVGSAASDIVRGMAGDDVLSGGDRHDGLNGGDGNDVLKGDAGRDVLQGESGHDVLYGGADADKFWIASTGSGHDLIGDFQNGLDKIRITGVAGVDDVADLAIGMNGSGDALITFPDGSTITVAGVAAAEIEATDFVWI